MSYKANCSQDLARDFGFSVSVDQQMDWGSLCTFCAKLSEVG